MVKVGLVLGGGGARGYAHVGVLKALEIFWKTSAMMGLAFWLGLFWRRTTVAGNKNKGKGHAGIRAAFKPGRRRARRVPSPRSAVP